MELWGSYYQKFRVKGRSTGTSDMLPVSVWAGQSKVNVGMSALVIYQNEIRAFPPLYQSKRRLCSTNHRAGYFSNLTCDWLSIV